MSLFASRFAAPRLALLAAAASGVFATSAHAALIFEETFNDAPGTTPPTGFTVVTGSTANDPVAEGSLSYPGLKPSVGNRFTASGTNSSYSRVYTDDNLDAGETVFYSFLFRLDAAFTSTSGFSSNNFLIASSDTTSTGRASFGLVRDADNPSAYNFVFDGEFRGPSRTDDSVRDTTEFTVGQTVLLVASYTRPASGTGASAQFFVNPDASTFGGTAPTPTATDVATVQPVDRFLISVGANVDTAPTYSIDELRVGDTYADVTPVPEPAALATIALAGAALLRRRR